MLEEEESVGDTWGDPHALVDTPTDTLAEVEDVAEKWGFAHALLDTG